MDRTYINRSIETRIIERLTDGSNKIVLLYGPRQVGKTTLARHIIQTFPDQKILEINGDFQPHSEMLLSRNPDKIRLYISGYDYLFVDEAQRIPDIGINLKIIHDQFPELRILVTGSSSLDLANRVHEPLTGRTWTFRLHPFSACELISNSSLLTFDNRLHEWLIYGSFPGVLQMENKKDKELFLHELVNAYLFKDVLELSGLRHSRKLYDLLRLLAFQVGSEVSYNECGKSLGLDTATVQKYIDLLEKSFVIKTVGGFSRNLRKEISKKQKIYFLDLGIRNTIIENFNDPDKRNDTGAMWENYLFLERTKFLENSQIRRNQYFWRLHTGAEIDYVEEGEGELIGFEFKYSNKNIKPPKSWTSNYPSASFGNINRDNYISFICASPAKRSGNT